MRCPYCGDRPTEVLKTVYRGHNSYRHRRCLHCGSRFSIQERPVRGAAWIGSGRDPALYGRDGGVGGRQLCWVGVRLKRAEWISNKQESGVMWTTLC